MDKLKSPRIALLLNALVMPGAGHIYLGKAVKGYLMSIAVFVLLIIPIVRYTMAVVDGLNNLIVGGNISSSAISAISGAWAANKNLILYSLLGIVIIWIYGIVDVMIEAKRISRINADKNTD